MRTYIEKEATEDLKPYEHALLDFGIHLKLARRMGWVAHSAPEEQVTPVPAGMISCSSPLAKRKKLNLNRVKGIVKSKDKKRKWSGDAKIRRMVINFPFPFLTNFLMLYIFQAFMYLQSINVFET